MIVVRTLLLLVVLNPVIFAQNKLLNADFEDWAIANNGLDSLEHWSSSNTVVVHPVISLYKHAGAFHGDYAVKLVTAPFGVVQYSKVGILVNGSDALFDWNGGGGYSTTYVSGGGTPVSVTPTALKGYYKSEVSAPGSQGLAQVFLTRFNTALGKRDTVSQATYDFTPASAYTPFTVSLPDLIPGVTPDTIITFFYASNPSTVPEKGAWAALYLDNITLDAPPLAPVADFFADSLEGSVNTLVTFTDNSSNTPTSRKWSFMPDRVAFENGFSDTSANPVLRFTATGDYSVKLVVGNADGSDSLTKADYIHIKGEAGIGQIQEKESVLAYPNPAKDVLRLMPHAHGARLQIVDMYGKTVIEHGHLDGEAISVAALKPGFYIVKLSDGSSTWVDKLLIKK